MTQEQKAKAYDEALERAKAGLNNPVISEVWKTWTRDLFSELKESEDERIRKEIIEYFENCNIKHLDWITWLEKQGERKSADNAEPKFKVGDWVQIERGNVMKILEVEEEVPCYKVLNWYGGESIRKFSDIDSIAHLWSIEDAKDGDVLHASSFSSDCIFVFDRLDKWEFDEPNGDRVVATGHCCLTLSADNMEFGIQGPDCIEVDTVKPATKIQRDLLFQKMHEAGYEWDAEKKELKKIEHMFRVGDEIRSVDGQYEDIVLEVLSDGSYRLKNLGILPIPEDEWELTNVPVDGYELIDKKELKKIHTIDEGKAEIDYCFTKMMNGEKVSSTWSEEDELKRSTLIHVVKKQHGSAIFEGLLPEELLVWLKSLKDRVQPEQEWSEEDMFKVQRICKYLDEAKKYYADITEVRDCIDWLKSLGYRSRWKPTKEQMEAMKRSFAYWQGTTKEIPSSKLLESLYNDLKKL